MDPYFYVTFGRSCAVLPTSQWLGQSTVGHAGSSTESIVGGLRQGLAATDMPISRWQNGYAMPALIAIGSVSGTHGHPTGLSLQTAVQWDYEAIQGLGA